MSEDKPIYTICREIINTLSEPIALVDTAYHYQFVNDAYLNIFPGKTKDDICGMTVAELFGREFWEQVIKPKFDRCLAGETVHYETWFPFGEGRERYFFVTDSPLIGTDGAVRGVAVIGRDMTEQHGYEERLTNYRLIIDNTEEKIAILDTRYRYLLANDAYVAPLGVTKEYILGKTVGEMLGPEVFAELKPRLDACFAGERQHFDNVLPYPRVGVRQHRATYFPIRSAPNGPVEKIVVNISDVTEQKMLEEQFAHAQKMETVGRLAGGIAHDINNLLTVIVGNAELALLAIEEGGAPTVGEIEEIKGTANRAAKLISQLLAFSRRQFAAPRTIDLNQVLRSSEQLLRRLIRENIEMTTLPGEDLWPVKIDPNQLEQVLTNLVINARDAMPSGGKLTIESQNVTLTGEYATSHFTVEPGDYVMLAVSDNGVGMDEDTRSKAFEPFFTTKSRGKGSGLGLSSCYGIVKQNGGYIWLYSESGKGSTVKVYLPRSRAKVSVPPPETPADVPGGTETILVVEDEPSVRGMVVRILETHGYRVIAVGNGEEGLRAFESGNPPIDLVITDVVMPRMGGREMLENILAAHPGIPGLYISGYTDNSIVHNGVLTEGIEFLPKPFTPADILRRVRTILDRS